MIPRAVRVFQIGSDFLLGLVRDDLGVESIVLYEFATDS